MKASLGAPLLFGQKSDRMAKRLYAIALANCIWMAFDFGHVGIEGGT